MDIREEGSYAIQFSGKGVIGGVFDCDVVVSAISKKIPAGSIVVLETKYGWNADSVKVGLVDAGEKKSFTIKASAVEKDILALPEKIEFSLRTSEPRILHTAMFPLGIWNWQPVSYLSSHFENVQESTALNVMCFGPVGAGKSSLISSIKTVLGDSKTPEYEEALALGGVSHGSVHLREHTPSDLPLRMIDTWGLAKDTYTKQNLEKIIKGEVPFGWHMEKMSELKERPEVRASHKGRRVHGLLYFVPVANLANQTAMNELRDQLNVVRKQMISPLVLLARIDERIENIRKNPQELLASSQELKDLRSQVAQTLGVPEGTILPTIPYHLEQERSMQLEKLVVHTLDQALRMARNKYDKDQKDDFEEQEARWEIAKAEIAQFNLAILQAICIYICSFLICYSCAKSPGHAVIMSFILGTSLVLQLRIFNGYRCVNERSAASFDGRSFVENIKPGANTSLRREGEPMENSDSDETETDMNN
eukprot:gb/GEZN01007173.1/.p1 GENE.gb/GEZN01007173.1/~~gb/GEZN01007173.1/.p1  ORF type:complete len:479 (+),score=49.71 gb/GEZN01007173.1/:30-1466(+)